MRGNVAASAGVDPRNPGIVLPIVEIQGVATSAAYARETARRATQALLAYVEQEQCGRQDRPAAGSSFVSSMTRRRRHLSWGGA